MYIKLPKDIWLIRPLYVMLLMRANPLLGQMGGGLALEILTFWATNGTRLTARCHYTRPKKSSIFKTQKSYEMRYFSVYPKEKRQKIKLFTLCTKVWHFALSCLLFAKKKEKHICWEVQNWGCPETHQGAAFLPFLFQVTNPELLKEKLRACSVHNLSLRKDIYLYHGLLWHSY